jgi:hypothetical protein
MTSSTTWTTPDLDRTIRAMDERVSQFAQRNDPRERFLLMYRTFKNELRRNLQMGRFADTRWSEAICCRMAEMYFEADVAYHVDRTACPEPWVYAFDAATAGELNLLQDMLLGMNAHINYDLPFCAYDTMRLFGDVADTFPAVRDVQHGDVVFDSLLRSRYSDFLLINQIAWESIDLIQDVATRRFSRMLGIAAKLDRAVPLQLSRVITTRVISEYRDRAWGHTLLLLLAKDVEQLEAVTRLASQFAMDAAELVSRVDFRPVNSTRLLVRGRVLPDNSRRSEPEHSQTVIPFLAAQLGVRPTRRIARRALIEYGPSIQQQLADLLDAGDTSTSVRPQLLQVIAAHPTPLAAAVLQRQISSDRADNLDVSLRLLADMRVAGVELNADVASLGRVIDGAVRHARWLAACDADLDVLSRGELLDETLRLRQMAQLRRILYAGVIQRPERHVMSIAESLSLAPAPAMFPSISRAIDSIVPGLGNDLVLPLARTAEVGVAGDEERGRERLTELCFHTDPWLRACALHRIGELGLRDVTHVVEPALNAAQPLVQEAALYSLAKLLDRENLSATVEPRLGHLKAVWVRDYAERLLTHRSAEEAMYSTIEKVLLLKNAELFVDIPAEELAEIAGAVQYGSFRKGARLIKEGTPGEALYLLVRGEVDVVSADGRRLARVEPYAVLGETSILLDEPCTATCVAATAGHALRIDRSHFQQLLLDYPDVTLGMLRVMTRRVQIANQGGDPVASMVS